MKKKKKKMFPSDCIFISEKQPEFFTFIQNCIFARDVNKCGKAHMQTHTLEYIKMLNNVFI